MKKFYIGFIIILWISFSVWISHNIVNEITDGGGFRQSIVDCGRAVRALINDIMEE